MGQQQLLFIVLGIIIIGIAIALGIVLFRQNAIDSKRNNIINEALNLASMAQKHYFTPSMLGGGNNSFEKWDIPDELKITANGEHYIESIGKDSIVLISSGNELVTDKDSVKVRVTIYPKTNTVTIIN